MKKRYEEIKGNSIHNLYILIVLYLPLILSVNSCCSTEGCVGANQMDGIYLKNFATTDVDSIFISSYKKGTDFKIPTDSFMIEKCDSFGTGGYYMLFNYKIINIDNDYRIYFTTINKIYEVSGFQTSKAECNDCVIPNYYTRLDAYEINLNLKHLGFIEIDKGFD